MASDRDRLSYDARQQYRSVVAQQGRVMVPADFNEMQEIAGEEVRREALDFVGPSGTPDNGYAIAFPAPAGSPDFDFAIGPGTMYVGGIRAFLPAPATYFNQPDWLNPDATAKPATELILLNLQEQEIGATEDPSLKDVALGGPDTTQRTRIMQHVTRQAIAATDCASALSAQEQLWTTGGRSFDPATMRLNSLAALKVSFENSNTQTTACDPVAQGGYLGAENQLIRVRLAGKDQKNNDTFVWGFDNSSFLYTVTLGSDNQTLTFNVPPVDSFHYPRTGQVVEVLATEAALANGGAAAADTGQLFTLAQAYDPDTQSVTLPAALTIPIPTGHPQLFLRVWENQETFTAGQPVTLGSTGVQVTLQAPKNVFNIGDYWSFAVRPNTPAQVYPQRYLDAAQPPDGPRQWACPLAVIQWTNKTGQPLSDCRNFFDNLVDLTKRRPGGSCCTVMVQPEDLTGGVTLQTIVDQLVNVLKTSSAAICLQPGVYTLTQPLILGSQHSGLTIEGCHGDVVIQGDGRGNFLHGLLVLNQADNIAIQGLRFILPATQFAAAGGLLAGIPADLLKTQIDGPDISALITAIGIRVLACAGLRMEECKFDFQTFASQNQTGIALEAGIFGTGQCSGLTLRNNQFILPTAQLRVRPPIPVLTQAPAQVRAAVQVPIGTPVATPAPIITVAPPPPPIIIVTPPPPPPVKEARFGFLFLPCVSSLTLSNQEETSFSISANILPSVLDQAVISGNAFSGLSAAVLIQAEMGNVRMESNSVSACYSGFQLFESRFLSNSAIATVEDILGDLPFSLGAGIGSGFPLPPQFVPRGQPSPSGARGVFAINLPSDPTLAQAMRLFNILKAAEDSVLNVLTRGGTGSFLVSGNEISTFIPGNSSTAPPTPTGSAFVIWGDPGDAAARLILNGNSMRGAPPVSISAPLAFTGIGPATAVAQSALATAARAAATPPAVIQPTAAAILAQAVFTIPLATVLDFARGAVTGNLVLNEGSDAQKISLWIATSNQSPGLLHIAITGNTLRGNALLPVHPASPSNLGNIPPTWDLLNLIFI